MGLSGIAAQVRIIIKWALIGLGGLVFIWVLFISLRALYRVLLPSKEDIPTIAFGRLPTPTKPNASLSKVEVDLDTPDGSLPSFPKLLEVYPIPQPTGKLNSLEIATEKARSLGVNGTPKPLSPTLYQWQDAKSPNRTVAIDIVSGNYNYKYDWVADQKVIAKTFTETVETEAKSLAKGFFSRDFKGANDLEKGEVRSNYVNISSSSISRVSSASEANAVEVNLFREKLSKKYDIVGFDPTKSLVNTLVTPKVGDQQILAANFIHWIVDFKSASTYPLRSSAQAYQDLKAGKAYIVAGKIANLDRIKIVDLKLYYLETEKYSLYLQPVYVFTGNSFAGKAKTAFTAYLPAVADSQLKAGP